MVDTMKMLFILAALLFTGCAAMQDALVPDEMSASVSRGLVTKMDQWFDEQDTFAYTVGFTWHLRRDERTELRAIRMLLETQQAKGGAE